MNTRELLRDCLESLEKQRSEIGLEVIVVDNASQDGTVAMVRERFEWVELVSCTENHGYSGGANMGLSLARGELLAVLNSDTIVHEGALKRLHEEMCSKPDVGLGCPRLVEPDGTLQIMRSKILTAWDHLRQICLFPIVVAARDSDCSGYIESPSGACLCFTRKGLEAIDGLDERLPIFLEEQDVARRIRRAGLRCYYVADALVTHFVNQTVSQIEANELWLATQRSHAYFYRAHFPWLTSAILRVSAAVWMALRVANSLQQMARGGEQAVYGRARLRVKLEAMYIYLFAATDGKHRLSTPPRLDPAADEQVRSSRRG